MKRELQTEVNKPICCKGDIFNNALRAEFADIYLLQKRDGKAEQEAVLAFSFCLLGVKEIQRTDSAVQKSWIKSPFLFPTSQTQVLNCTRMWRKAALLSQHLGRNPLPYFQFALMNLPWASQDVDPGSVGYLNTRNQTSVPWDAVI